MATPFRRFLSRSIGTSPVKVGNFVVAAASETCIGLSLANVAGVPITVDAFINDGTNNTYLIKGATIPPGMALVILGGDQKQVLITGDSIQVVSNTANAVDAILSVVEVL